ncbi:MAG: carboxypeptidase regulatory-like domain-containing protein [candidate division FCPU426 bacterium]
MRRAVSAAVFILGFLSCVLPPARAVWDIETVDSAGDTGWYCSLTMDASDRPHIAYYYRTSADLKYAYWNGSGWEISVVDGAAVSCGQYSSLALGASGYPRIAYRNSSGYIACALWNGTSWDLQTSGDTTPVGFGTSIAVGSDNSVHISYANTSYNSHRYSYYNGTSWSWAEILPNGYFMETSLALDSGNYPWIAAYSASADNVQVRYWNGAAWLSNNPPDTSEDDGYWPALKIDSAGVKHVSYCYYWRYYDDDPNNFSLYTGDLRYRTYNGATWSTPQVVDTASNTYSCTGWFTSLAVDTGNYAHISYHDHEHWVLKYATNATGSWVAQTIDPMTAQYFNTSIALDSANHPSICYYDQVNKDLKYARWVNGPYTISGTIVDGIGTPIAGIYVTLTGNGIESNYITGSDGVYRFAGMPANGSNTYTITPMLAGYIFSPGNRTYTNLSADQPNQDYMISAASGYFIRGYLVDNQGYVLQDALVTLSGSSAGTRNTGTTGYYEFTNLPAGGTYTLTPSKFGYEFVPVSLTYASINQNYDNQNYVGTSQLSPTPTPVPTYALWGYLRDSNGRGIPDATVNLAGTQTSQYTTDGNGYYGFNVIAGDYTLAPAYPNWVFDPTQKTYTGLAADQSQQNFVGYHQNAAPAANDVSISTSLFKPNEVAYTTIRFDTSRDGRVCIRLYSIDGVLVRTLLDEDQPAGLHSVTWNGNNQHGARVASGIYFVDVKTPNYRKMKKICVVK